MKINYANQVGANALKIALENGDILGVETTDGAELAPWDVPGIKEAIRTSETLEEAEKQCSCFGVKIYKI